MNGGGGEINELCESEHTVPSEMRGGRGGVEEPKGDHCFSKKILNPVRLKFERKNFSNDILQIFAQPFKLEVFCENFFRKIWFFTAC